MIDALVNIDLDQIPTRDLIEELKSRRAFEKNEVVNMDSYELIEQLESLGCPQRIINQLEEWDREPVADVRKLREWEKSCGVCD